MSEGSYWSRRRVSRRAALRGGATGLAGLVGAALIGCSGDDDAGGVGVAVTAEGGSVGVTTATPPAAAGSGATPVRDDQVRVTPGLYTTPVAASPAERDPLVNGKYGGTLRMRYLDPPHMDINRALSCTVYHTMDYTNSKLVRGKTGPSAHPFLVEVEPDLAESWEASPDHTVFTFHLRPGIKTHNVAPANGREYTSEDVALSIQRYQAGGAQRDVWSPVTSVETPDAHTVKVTLEQPLVDFPINVSAWSFMWIKELVENEDLLNEEAVGTGAFVREEWTRQSRSVFKRHPDYFEAGLPFVDEIVAVVENDTAALRAGFEGDRFFDWNARDDQDWEEMFEARPDTVVGWKHPSSRGANVNGWHFQLTNPVFQDERVRRAISLGFDRVAFDLADNAGDNQHEEGPFSNPPMPWAFLYDEQPTGAANGPWYQFDPEQASQLLQAAGYTPDTPLAWEHVTWYERQDVSEIIIPGLNEALPEVNIGFRQVDNTAQVTMLADRDFDATIGMVWGPPGHSMDQWIYPWWHSQGALNYNNVNDAEMDTLLERQRRATDLAERRELWQQVWDRIHDQVWDLWWPEVAARRAWHNYMLNYRGHGLMGTYVCYTSNQARAIWLDDGAPTVNR